MEKEQQKNNKQNPEGQTVPSYGLLYITRAYNRKEITLEEWLRLSKEWAEQVIEQYGSNKDP